MNDKEIKLKVLEAMKQAMMEDQGKKGMESHKPKGMLVIEKETVAMPKKKMEESSEEEGLEEESEEHPDLPEGVKEKLVSDHLEEDPEYYEEEEDLEGEGGGLLEKIKALRDAKKAKNIG